RCRSRRRSWSGAASPIAPEFRKIPHSKSRPASPISGGMANRGRSIRGSHTMNRLQAYLLSALLAFGASAAAQAQGRPNNVPSMPGAGAKVLPDFADLVEKYGPAIVNINTETRMQPRQGIPGLSEDDPFYEFFKRFMPPDQQGRQGPRGGEGQKGTPAPRGPLRPFGLGSGFIVSADGYIVTNAHVVENAEEIKVRLTDKRELRAKVIGVDMRSDVAVIKVD